MVSLVLTYRNRNSRIVEKCLNSLKEQSDKDFQVVLVDYGSETKSAFHMEELCRKHNFIQYQYVPVQGQLWNKSRAINIGLKKCTSPYFLMGDIDLVFHPQMISRCKLLMEHHDVVYFQYGFLSKNESNRNKSFNEYEPEFLGKDEVTGTTLFRTKILKAINGYDEFYHGWGAEDTDVHLRLKNAGHDVHFYDEEILVKHQWHPKHYRTKKSTAPFHTGLERINHQYMLQNHSLKVTRANHEWGWGIMPKKEDIERLEKAELKIALSSQEEEIDAFLTGIFPTLKGSVIIKISLFKPAATLKNRLKKYLKKKHFRAYDIETLNNLLLSSIITHHRVACYNYSIDWHREEISLSLVPYASK